jgi:2-oxoglutarate ferredoxin oxidoreductase subunit alpha
MGKQSVLLQGNEAVSEGAITAGVRFFAGYPITPATEVAEYLSKRMPEVGGTFLQMEDEIAGISAVLGASCGGIKAMTASSGPGLSLKAENRICGCAEFLTLFNVQNWSELDRYHFTARCYAGQWGPHSDNMIIVWLCFDQELFWLAIGELISPRNTVYP